MITPEFEVMSDKLLRSECPEDFFGNLSKDPSLAVEKIDSMTKKAKKVASFNTEGDANAEYRVSIFTSKIIFFEKWARKKIINGTYGDNITYCIKLELVVCEHEGKKFFLSKDKNREFYFNKISAIFFEGYLHCDKVEIKTKSGVVKKGRVSEYGTHAAQEYFFFDGEDMIHELVADKFNQGDIIEIETQKYMSWSEFYIHNVGACDSFITVGSMIY